MKREGCKPGEKNINGYCVDKRVPMKGYYSWVPMVYGAIKKKDYLSMWLVPHNKNRESLKDLGDDFTGLANIAVYPSSKYPIYIVQYEQFFKYEGKSDEFFAMIRNKEDATDIANKTMIEKSRLFRDLMKKARNKKKE